MKRAIITTHILASIGYVWLFSLTANAMQGADREPLSDQAIDLNTVQAIAGAAGISLEALQNSDFESIPEVLEKGVVNPAMGDVFWWIVEQIKQKQEEDEQRAKAEEQARIQKAHEENKIAVEKYQQDVYKKMAEKELAKKAMKARLDRAKKPGVKVEIQDEKPPVIFRGPRISAPRTEVSE